MNYKFLPHTADVKFQTKGDSLEEAFSNSFLALKETIAKEIEIKEKVVKEIMVKGTDLENLLYNFLEEFLYLLDAENFLTTKIKKIEIDEKSFTLKATILGDEATNYEVRNPVKAVTYNEMFVKEKGGKWFVQAVLDV